MKKTKDLNKLTLQELKKELETIEKKKDDLTLKKCGVWQVGKNYLIRTVTMIQVGKLVQVTDKELVLESAAWVVDTGRFNEFLQGKLSSSVEIEPFPDGHVIVGRGALIDATLWSNDLLRQVK